MKLEVGKTYRAASGLTVVIEAKLSVGDYPYIGVTSRKEVRMYNIEGKNSHEINPLVAEVTPYDGWEIDCKIRVKSSSDGYWCNRHFAGVDESGNPLAYTNGSTSWSSQEDPVEWQFIQRVL